MPGHRLSLADLRENYGKAGLLEENCDSNPIVQFERWLLEAQAIGTKEPNAMTLATATADGKPSARVVLLKEVSDTGFVWYTNYGSRKAQNCDSNPHAALAFYWGELERQVRVEGRVARVPRPQSEAYFRSRPKGSRLGAWASAQSKRANSREEIDGKIRELERQYAGTDEIPVPEFWGGYRLLPDLIEFWQGRPNRLHDRIRYLRTEDAWSLERLWQ